MTIEGVSLDTPREVLSGDFARAALLLSTFCKPLGRVG